jgi:prepilin-type N-terminal cleavage/methylation domain-containing protein
VVNTKKAFTLIELLVVIGILSVLLAIVLIAINPARQFSQANNTKRRSDVNAILNAVHQYAADNKGNITPLGILEPDPTPTVLNGIIGTDAAAARPADTDLCALLVTEYMAALPVDPLTNNGAPITDCAQVTDYTTDYRITRSATNSRITVSAPGAELNEVITVTR